jgi:hypothetical protein
MKGKLNMFKDKQYYIEKCKEGASAAALCLFGIVLMAFFATIA